MSTDIDSIKRKLLIKYPTFGSVIAKEENDIGHNTHIFKIKMIETDKVPIWCFIFKNMI